MQCLDLAFNLCHVFSSDSKAVINRKLWDFDIRALRDFIVMRGKCWVVETL